MGTTRIGEPSRALAGKGALDEAAAAEVLLHLEDVLASPAFRSSQRSQEFLRYVVTHALESHSDQLKERLIGEHVFGRPPDYDTGQDAIVRVKANEVRRRLAQYYDLHPHAALRIDLAAGTYAPQFHHPAHAIAEAAGQSAPPATAKPADSSRIQRRRWAWLPVLGVPAVLVAALLVGMPGSRGAMFNRFWEPVLAGAERLTICIPNPEAYRIYGRDKERLIETFRPRPPGTPQPPIPVGELKDVKIVPEPNLSVGLGDARALALIHSFVQSRGKTPQIRLAGETTFTELRANNPLLLGGFTNRWTMELTKDLRFRFYRSGEAHEIRDGKTDKALCRKPNSWEPPSTLDCALVTRLIDSKTGRPLLIAAGLDHYGTFAVGEFITRPEMLESALAEVKGDWTNRNVQIVIQVEVVRDNVGPPKVIASHVW